MFSALVGAASRLISGATSSEGAGEQPEDASPVGTCVAGGPVLQPFPKRRELGSAGGWEGSGRRWAGARGGCWPRPRFVSGGGRFEERNAEGQELALK